MFSTKIKEEIRNITLYLVLSLLVLGLLLKPGYVLTFDMSWGPEIINGTGFENTKILNLVLVLCSYILPSWLIQKVILVLIFFLSGLGAHKLAQLKTNTYAYFAGVLYVFNPFVYTRLMAGQWLVLLGYALLPWTIRAIYLFYRNPNLKNSLKVILWLALITYTSIHTIGIILSIAVLLATTISRSHLKKVILSSAVTLSILLILNSFWIIPILSGQSSISENINNIQNSELYAFKTSGTILNSPLISSVFLTGFWADSQNRYLLPSALPIWWLGVLGILSFVVIGAVSTIRKKDKRGIVLLIAGFIALILALGVSTPITEPIALFLDKHIPFYSGYREPHKWLMLLAIMYSYFVAIGSYQFIQYIKSKFDINTNYVKYLLLIIPFFFAPTLAFGAAGQLKSSDYPQSWYQAKTYIELESKNPTIVVFPWHQYLPISFTGRVVANPARYFFSGNIIVSGDPELSGVSAKFSNETSKYITTELLPFTDKYKKAGEILKGKNVDYVILLKESDWERYLWLYNSGMQNIIENENLVLFKF